MKIGSLIICGNEEVKLGQQMQSFLKTPSRPYRISQISGKFLISLFRSPYSNSSTVSLSARAQCPMLLGERTSRLKAANAAY